MKKLLLLITIFFISQTNFAQDLLMQSGTVTACTGTFYDTGGAAGQYQNNENFTGANALTICPTTPGAAVVLNFTAFNLQPMAGPNGDFMRIYDGPDTTAPLIGEFNGDLPADSPGMIMPTPANTSGCLTIEFTSDGFTRRAGWAADISCFTPCQSINAVFDSSNPPRDPITNEITACQNQPITFNGSGIFSNTSAGAVYTWFFNDGTSATGQTVTHSFAAAGYYDVNLVITDPLGCTSSNDISVFAKISTTPDFTGTQADVENICLGETADITGVVNATPFNVLCTIPIAGVTQLGDGPSSGVPFEATIPVACFAPNAVITTATDILNICINMEHSFLGDLDISLVSPDGTEVFFKTFPGGGGTFLGEPIDNDGTPTIPGVGYTYCFAPGATTLLVNGPTVNVGGAFPGTAIAPGTYRAVTSFDDFIGSPLNGDWTIRILDNLNIDNGFIFSVELNFDPNIIPPDVSFTPNIVDEFWQADPTIIATNGNVITVQPTTTGQVCYTYEVLDDFGCTYTETVCLNVVDPPVANMPPDQARCDDGTSDRIFNLRQDEAILLGGQDPTQFNITYHLSQAEADLGTPAINNPGTYTLVGASQEIFVRIETLDRSCFDTTSFTISYSVATAGPFTPLDFCNPEQDGDISLDLPALKDIEALNGQNPADFNVTYHLTQNEAQMDMGALPVPANISGPTQIIWVRVENSTDPTCAAVANFTITINPQPFSTTPPDIEVCDDGTIGDLFDLTQNTPFVLGTQDTTLFNVTYHTTQAGADTGTPVIGNPTAYQIVGDSQTIYVRVADLSGSCIADPSVFFQITYSSAEIGVLTDENFCDQQGTGTLSVDLEALKDVEALDGQDPTLYNVTYHLSQNDADSDTGSLPNPYIANTPGVEIFVRVESRNNETCFATGSFDIIIEDSPAVNPTPLPLVVCDTDNDGFAFFDLTDADGDINLGDPTLVITYHGTLLDAQNGLRELTNPYENDQPYNDVVFVRIVSATTDCYSTVELMLEVRNRPIGVDPTPLRLCDDDTDGTQSFDLTVKEDEILSDNNTGLFDFYYYELEQDAIDAGESALTAPDYSASIPNSTNYQNISSPQFIYVLIVGNSTYTDPNNGGVGCYSVVRMELIVDPLPVVVQPLPYQLCDDEVNGSTRTDQISTFNLPTRNGEITAGDNNLVVTWYETLADEAADLPIADPTAYQNREIPPAPLTPQTIIARVTNRFGCETLVTLTLVVNPNPTPASPTPLEVCDDNNDGFSLFDLTLADIQILNNNGPEVEIAYYPTRPLAELGDPTDAITGLYPNVVPFNDTVFARLSNTITGCYTIVPLSLVVNPLPDVPTPDFGDLTSCDLDGGGSAVFDLTQNTAAVYGTQDPADFTINYYISFVDADAGDNEIGNPQAFPSSGQTIWVRLGNNGTGCARISTFELIIGEFPVIQDPLPMALCDDVASGSNMDEMSIFDLTSNDAFITNGDSSLQVFYYETQADQIAGNFINPASAYTNTTIGNMTLFVSVSNTTGCIATTTLTLIVNPVPVTVTPDPLEICDDNNDGFAEFDLTLADTQILNGNGADVTVAYYRNRAEAEGGDPADAITGPYPNVIPFNDTVFARLTNNVTSCFNIVALPLVVNPLPNVPTSDFGDLTSCDLTGGGTATFDLTENTAAVYGTQDPAGFTISYHLSQSDAQSGSGPIINTTAFSSSGQTIWVRLEDNDTGCARISSFDLTVGTFPIISNPVTIEVCDDVESGSNDDGTSVFDLTLNDAFITNGDTALQVFYFETQADQTAGNFIDPATEYTNTTPGNMTLFVTVTNGTGCEATTTLTLIVNPVPSPATPDPLVVCDVDNDGIAEFNLTDADAQIINGEPGVTVTYHELLSDAQDGIFPLSDPYQTIFLGSQTVYARATYTLPPNTTGCYDIVELELQAIPTPILPNTLPPIVLCDPDGDGIAQFDLTQQEPLIYGTQDPAGLVLTYHRSLDDAIDDVNAIVNTTAFTNTSNPQDIFIRLESADTGCFKTGTFEIEVTNGAAIFDPTPLTLCDDVGEPFDGITTFDLTSKDDEITGGVTGQGVSYFETEQNALDNIDRIDPDTAYENTQNLQTIYVRVQDANTSCVSYTTLLLRVIPNPAPTAPDPIILCDEVTPNDGFEIFDLTSAELQILNGATWTITYHESYDQAFDGVDAIVDPENYTNLSSPQVIYVRAENAATGCFEIVELQLIVNPLPDDSAIVSDYIICEIDTDGFAIFDLTEKDGEVLNGQDGTIFTVRYFESEAEAENNSNFIVNSDRHQNNGNPQTIWVGILNNDTGCYVGGAQQFDIEVREGAVANPVAEPYVICDNIGENDGIGSFDLTDPALAGQILGGQTTPPYELTYYETIENAMAGVDPIIGDYENIINPQIVYARVTNTDTDCFDITEVILKVELLPIIELPETLRLCVDEDGNPIPQDSGEDSPPVIDTGLDPAIYTFVWEVDGAVIAGETGPSIIAVVGGEYTVTVTDTRTNCETTATTTVIVSSPPIVFGADVTSDAFADSHIITVTAEGEGENDYIFQLDFGPFQDSNVFENVSPGTHTVTIKDRNGCGSVTIEVTTVDYPLFFTPNQDGYHDTWNVVGIGQLDPSANIYIFDRFGKLLKQLSPLGNGWDGTYNGEALPSSDYWFQIEYKERDQAKQIRGHFTLKR